MGDPIPTRKLVPLPNYVDVIILSRPCELSKFIKVPERARRKRKAAEGKEE